MPERHRFYGAAIERIRTIPGVRSAAISIAPPPFSGPSSPIQIPGVALPEQARALLLAGGDQLLETIGLPIVKGRPLSRLDVERSLRVAIVNEAFVRTYLGTHEPLGQAVKLEMLGNLPVPLPDPTFQIIGVVRDAVNQGPDEPPAPPVLVPYSIVPIPVSFQFVMRTADDPMRVVSALRREMLSLDRDVALLEPRTLEDEIQRTFFARPRFTLLVLGIFACTGMLLVAFGIYGVLAYTVSQQTREIAIRMALGGDRGHVVGMVLGLGFRLVALGVAIGIAVSLLTNRLLVSQLWNTSPTDPATFLTVVLMLLAVGAVACWVPARRAVRVEPMVALRHE